jgi:predicted nucleic acid-binding protein
MVFLDIAYILALINKGDEYHERAHIAVFQVSEPLVTTEAILLEIGNALSRQRWRQLAVITLQDLRNDPEIEIVPLTSELLKRSEDFYAARMDEEWSLTDCVSFVVMRDRNIDKALTLDRHFQQAGFCALLLNG